MTGINTVPGARGHSLGWNTLLIPSDLSPVDKSTLVKSPHKGNADPLGDVSQAVVLY